MHFVIVTPSLNQLPFLKRCVASIRDQAVSGVSLEHWVIDGGSDDGTVEWLQANAIPYISEPDGGMYDALNKGLERMRTCRAPDAAFAWLNCDEQYLPGALDRIARNWASHPDVDILCGDALVVDVAGHLLTYWKSLPLRRSYLRIGTLYNLTCAMFFHARLIRPGVSFDSTLRATADRVFVDSLLESGARSHCIGQYVAAYTYMESNLSNQEAARRERRQRSDRLCKSASLPLRIVRAVERMARGTRRQRFPLEYSVYLPTGDDRLLVRADWVPAKWPGGDTD